MLAYKHKSSIAKMTRKYATTWQTPEVPRKCLEVQIPREGKSPLIARFGDIPLKVNHEAIIKDERLTRSTIGRTELVQRLLANVCQACSSTHNIEVHHIRKLADLHQKGSKPKPEWIKLMASRKRKTLVLCRECHRDLHAGRPLRRTQTV